MYIDDDNSLGYAVSGDDAEGFGQFSVERLYNRPDKAAINLTLFDELCGYSADHVGGYRKSNTDIAAAGGKDRGIDPHELSI